MMCICNFQLDNDMTKICFTHLFIGLPLRPFPRDVAMRIPGYFKQCDRDRCVGPRCTFTHNNLELQEWNREKQKMLNCKLLMCLHRYSLLCVCVCVDQKQQLQQQPPPLLYHPRRSLPESYSYKVSEFSSNILCI